MAELAKRFGRMVAAYRRTLGMTQSQLAEAADISGDMISKLEIGATGASFATVERIARVLKIDPGDLFATDQFARLRGGDYLEITTRLAALSDDDLRWLKGVLNAALANKH